LIDPTKEETEGNQIKINITVQKWQTSKVCTVCIIMIGKDMFTCDV
jgi:hypothetical protein